MASIKDFVKDTPSAMSSSSYKVIGALCKRLLTKHGWLSRLFVPWPISCTGAKNFGSIIVLCTSILGICPRVYIEH